MTVEVEAMLFELIETIKNRRASVTARRALLIGIDGRSGAGKSTLARCIEDALEGVAVVHKDDFYSAEPPESLYQLSAIEGYDRYFDWQRLKEQVLQPLSSGRSSSYRRYDWCLKALGARCSIPESSQIVIVEGVYSLRPELRQFYDIKVCVSTNEALRASRLIARGENSMEWISRWSAAEDFYFEHIFTDEQVTFVTGEES